MIRTSYKPPCLLVQVDSTCYVLVSTCTIWMLVQGK